MNINLFPLQVSITNFTPEAGVSVLEVVLFFSIFCVIVGIVVIINNSKKVRTRSGKGGFFSFFSLHRLTKNIGLNREQVKMLDFVLKNDAAIDPERSIKTPALLDRHFKRAYTTIEKTSVSEMDAQRKLSILFSTRNILDNCAIGTISTTKQLSDDTILTFTYGKERIEVSVLFAKGQYLAAEIPKTILGSSVKVPRNTKLTVVFYTKDNKAFSFDTHVIGYAATLGIPSMMLAHSGQLKFLSQRRFRRRHATIPSTMFMVHVEGKGKKQRLILDKRRVTAGNIVDISVGGCSMKTQTPVQVGARFKIEFSMGLKNIAVLGQVLRTNRTGASLILHVRFLKVTLKSMNVINAFVYEYANE
jgi:hypothetical protein